MEEERAPFPTDDPRQKGTGDQYPEENPEGQAPAEGAEQGPSSGTGDTPAPSTSSPQDGDPGQATGNPRAAGADA
jgi:hypothetical protein